MLHHGNIDRMWALYQDYYNQDRIAKGALSSTSYTAGRGIGLDDPLPFTTDAGTYPKFFLRADGQLPTPRDVIHNVGETVQVTYANDYIGYLLSTIDKSYVTNNNKTWVQLANGIVPEIPCSSRRLQGAGSNNSTGNITISEASDILKISEDVPPWSNLTTRLIWDSLTAEGLAPQDILNTLAYRDCQEQGNQIMASPEWIAMQGMGNSSELFRCFSQGDPQDCIPNIDIVSSDHSFKFPYNPVSIVEFGDMSVQFALSQVWQSSAIALVAVHYENARGSPQCDTAVDMTGEIGVYEAKCVDGLASIKLYAHDPSITMTAPAGSITRLCAAAGIPSTNTLVHSITMPCSLEGPQCALPLASEPICDGTSNYSVAMDTFNQNFNDTSSWAFGFISSSSKVGSFLELDQGTSTTYRVPTTANSLTVTLKVYEVDCSAAANVTLLVGSIMVDLGVFNCNAHDSKSFISSSVGVSISSQDDRTDIVALTIPPDFYKDTGRLPIGVQNSLIGIGSLTVTADCTDIVPVWQDPAVVSVIDQVVVP
jgi:hypothetical protein